MFVQRQWQQLRQRPLTILLGTFLYSLGFLLPAQICWARPILFTKGALTLNHLQVKGGHNSYHLQPFLPLSAEWKYSQPPLDEQLEKHHVRQFELDLHWNPLKHEFQVYHVPLVDARSSCKKFTKCLELIQQWSQKHPQHQMIFVFLEWKGFIKPKSYLQKTTYRLDAVIASAIPQTQLFTPAQLQGDYPTLAAAVQDRAWPTIDSTRGKIAFVLLANDSELIWQFYTQPSPQVPQGLKDRKMFVLANVGSPFAAITKFDNPLTDFKNIQQSVKQGLLVRTRADSGAQINLQRLTAALNSGAHFISTDWIDETKRPHVVIPGGTPSRCNPVLAPTDCLSISIENLHKRKKTRQQQRQQQSHFISL